MAVLVVTDTHALVWYATGQQRKLGPRARKLFERVDEGHGAMYVPTIALVEVAEAAQRGSVTLAGGFLAWSRRLLSSGRFFSADLTWDIVVRAQELCAIPERGDRLIAATAMELGHPLITRDPEIAAAAGVDVIW